MSDLSPLFASGAPKPDKSPHGLTHKQIAASVKPGFSYGETDPVGYDIIKDPVEIRDLHRQGGGFVRETVRQSCGEAPQRGPAARIISAFRGPAGGAPLSHGEGLPRASGGPGSDVRISWQIRALQGRGG